MKIKIFCFSIFENNIDFGYEFNDFAEVRDSFTIILFFIYSED